MKIHIEQQLLIKLLAKTQNIVEKKTTMPVLINVLLEASENQFKAFATDLEVSLTDSVPCETINPGKVVVNAKNLFEIIKELSSNSIQLTKKDNNWLEIKQGKYISSIVGISSDEYPVFPTNLGSDFFTISSSLLKDMIEKTIYSVSTDESRYHLNGVYMEQKSDFSYTLVATDGHRLSLINRNIPSVNSHRQTHGVIIPRKGLNEIKKLLETFDGNLEFTIDGPQIILRHENTILMIRLVEGKYPSYQQFIPQKLSFKICVNREAFLGSLKRVSLLANQKSKAVTLIISKGKMEISSNNPELGDAKEELDVNFFETEIKISFNSKYVTDILNSISDENISFEMNDHLSPAIITPYLDPKYICVVMPMRI